MDRMNIEERLREATRDVASAFHTPLHRVELITEDLRRKALEDAFGEDPSVLIGERLAGELQADALQALRALRQDTGAGSEVIDFPRLAAGND